MIHAALMLVLFAAPAQETDPDKVRITLSLENVPMGKILEMLTQISGIPIELDDAAKKSLDLETEMVSMKVDKITLSGALRLLLGPRNFEAKWVEKKKLVISPKGS